MVEVPDGATAVMIPGKFLPLLQEISHGPFLPLDFPLPIICSSQVPSDEIWFVMGIEDGEEAEGDISAIEVTVVKIQEGSDAFKMLTVGKIGGDRPLTN